MEEFSKVLTSITWEHLLFVFSLVFIFVFQKPISLLIPKIRKIGKDGLTTDSTPETQLETKNTEAVQQLLDVVGQSIVIADLERRIEDDLKKRSLPISGDTNRVLIRHLAGTQLLLNLEQIHGLIFGSQIFLLKKLNEVTGQGRSIEFVNQYFDHVVKAYADNLGSWSREQYLEFLYNQQLIIKHDAQIHITNLGVEYLTWVARAGKSENRPL